VEWLKAKALSSSPSTTKTKQNKTKKNLCNSKWLYHMYIPGFAYPFFSDGLSNFLEDFAILKNI
jgi:hypothetical protein